MQEIETDHNFEPSMKILSRIVRVLIEDSMVGKTELLQKANLNHIRLTMHLKWLEQKNLIEYVVVVSRIYVKLTEHGREFAVMFALL